MIKGPCIEVYDLNGLQSLGADQLKIKLADYGGVRGICKLLGSDPDKGLTTNKEDFGLRGILYGKHPSSQNNYYYHRNLSHKITKLFKRHNNPYGLAYINVIRDGVETSVVQSELLVGDVISITSGTYAAATCLIISGEGTIDTSVITGITGSKDVGLTAHPIIYANTLLTSGNIKGIVIGYTILDYGAFTL